MLLTEKRCCQWIFWTLFHRSTARNSCCSWCPFDTPVRRVRFQRFSAVGQNSAYSHNQSPGGKKTLGFFGWQGTGNCIWWQRWAITAGKRGKDYCNKFMRRQPVAKKTNLVDFREMDFKSNLLASRVPALVLIIFHFAQGYGLQFNCVPFCFDCENLATQGSNTPLNLFQRKVHLNPRLEYGLPER